MLNEKTLTKMQDLSELNRIFSKSELLTTHNVIPKHSYVLHISATLENEPYIAISLANKTCEVLQLSNSQISKLNDLTEHTNTIVDVKFDNENSNLLYTGSNDGSIRLWDLRTHNKSVAQFKDTTEDEKGRRCFTCFDTSANNMLLCAGTELFKGDSYILFWDIRGNDLLGAYWESHTDDVTQVKFHSTDSNKLISGSLDGLINLYDLSKPSEDDALIDSFNTEVSVEKIDWLEENGKDIISCISYTAVQFWKLEDAEPYIHLNRNDIVKEIMSNSQDVYVINTHRFKNNLLILAGSCEDGYNSLRALRVNGKKISPSTHFTENKQRVRCSWMNGNLNLLLTGGEKGILNVWRTKL